MPTAARLAPAPRRLANAGAGALLGRRAAELGGIGLSLAGVVLLLALATYDPRDPSLNTATARAATNLAGPAGAAVADLLLQYFGVAGGLPGVALLAWAWRLATRRGLGSLPMRLFSSAIALPVLAALLSLASSLSSNAPAVAVWPTVSGPGGAVGRMIAPAVLRMGMDAMGPLGAILVVAGLSALGLALTVLSLGLTAGEWRAAGRSAARVARASAAGGQVAATGVADGLAWGGSFGRAIGVLLGRGLRRDRARADDDASFEAAGRQEPRAPLPRRAPEPDVAEREPHVELRPTIVARPQQVRLTLGRRAAQQEELPLADAGWRFPPLSLLKQAPERGTSGPSPESLDANARLLETVLSDYGVTGRIVEIRPGPVVTLYELEPAPGIRSARVIGLADDVARSLSVTAVRIATVPGRNVIGIEVPNARRETVYLSEVLEADDAQRQSGRLALALGKDIAGNPVVADLARMPHLMIAGTTGSGKSVGINAMILSLLYRLSPDQCRLILIDPKMLELAAYEGIPHLMSPVVTEPAKAVTALKWTVREMERRYRQMSQLGVRNIASYNERVGEARSRGEVVTRRVQTGFDPDTGRPTFEEQPLALETLPLIVVVVDEMADLMMVAGKEIEAAVQRLAQMARAAGIHVIMATQRPSVDVITGTIKANFPTRISFQVISKFDSRTILGEQGAEQLLGQGDMLYMAGGGRIVRVHGPFVSDREVEQVVEFLRAQGEPAYVEEVTEGEDDDGSNSAFSGIAGASDGEKGLFDQAVSVVAREGKASTSFIQRHLSIGYNRAAKLIEQMEKEGIVGPANHVGKREVLVRRTNDD